MELRLIPVVTFAAASLLAVKVVSLVNFDGHLPFETVFGGEAARELAVLDVEHVDGDAWEVSHLRIPTRHRVVER